ncbi:MAG: hypothetical protein EOO08_10225 [Chitinophagaceae bacterium]|nr:MAG: hypothetical protein EOO08_10225 [Chitinophagaceae bacterium]
MLRLLLSVLLFFHGFIHVMGFARAIGTRDDSLRVLSNPLGIAWLGTALLLMTAALLQLIGERVWWLPALCGLLVSQVLIISAWGDARWGTIGNVLLFLPAIGAFFSARFEQRYRNDVRHALQNEPPATTLLTEADLLSLPSPVRKYIRLTGAIGRPRPKSVRLVFEGTMRSRTKSWFPFHSEQYDCFGKYERMFFMKADFGGWVIPGYHYYAGGSASMEVRPFGIIPVVNLRSKELFRAETVTMLNDICLFAPGALVDPRITWTSVDDHCAESHFCNEGICVHARLYFNERGELVNFVSDDR